MLMNDINIGGIYRAVAPGGDTAALVLVTDIDQETESLAVTLLSPDIEFGSSTDLLLLGEETGRSYHLLAESDVFGYVRSPQLDRLIGRVDAQVLKAITALRTGDAVNHPVGGPPVVDRSDPRWGFKLQELERLQSLTADCARELIDGRGDQ